MKRKESLFAMKKISKTHSPVLLHTERHLLQQLDHPFIVKLYYCFHSSKEHVSFILEFAEGGELFSWIAREGLLLEDAAAFYCAEIALALHYLHTLGIVYRDLKPENVLLDLQGHVKRTDFGLAKQARRAETVCGTYRYMAPEMFSKEKRGKNIEKNKVVKQECDHLTGSCDGYDCNVDWWALGILLFDLLNGSPPFRSRNRKTLIDSIKKAQVQYPRHFAPNSKDFITQVHRYLIFYFCLFFLLLFSLFCFYLLGAKKKSIFSYRINAIKRRIFLTPKSLSLSQNCLERFI